MIGYSSQRKQVSKNELYSIFGIPWMIKKNENNKIYLLELRHGGL